MASFADNYWGEKNNGAEVLFSNIKLSGKGVSEFTEFLREFAALEDSYFKWLTKISKQIQANTSFNGCTMSPLWAAYKQFVEKLGMLHLQMSNRCSETSKQVIAYGEEQHKRSKAVRDSEAATLESVANFQLQNATLAKTREAYFARFAELERARRDSTGQRDLEKLEGKLRKACDDYRTTIERYNSARDEFERRHLEAARKLNEIEEQHLASMLEFSNTFIDSLSMFDSSYHDCVTQFKLQHTELGGASRLLQTYVRSSATGRDRPLAAHFESPSEAVRDVTLTSSSRIVSQSKDSLSKPPRGVPDKESFDRDSLKRESDRDIRRDEALNRGESPKPPDASSINESVMSSAIPRSTSSAFHLIRFDDSPTANSTSASTSQISGSQVNDDVVSVNFDSISPIQKSGNQNVNTSTDKTKKDAVSSGSLANVAAAMSRGLIKTTNWVGASIKQSRHKPKSKLSVGNRPESMAAGNDGELLSIGSTSLSTSSLKQGEAGAGAHAAGSAIDDLLSIDFGASSTAEGAQSEEIAERSQSALAKRKTANESDSDSSSDDDDDADDRAFRNIQIRIRPLEATGVDVSAQNDLLKARVAELKLSAVPAAPSRKKIQQRKLDGNTASASVDLSGSGSIDPSNDKSAVQAVAAAAPANSEFVADFSQFEQKVAVPEPNCDSQRATPTPSWVAFGHESADNTLVENPTAESNQDEKATPAVAERSGSVSSSNAPSNLSLGAGEAGRSGSELASTDPQFANFASFSNHFPASENVTDASANVVEKTDEQVLSSLPPASHSSVMSGKMTPNSLEVANLIPPPLPAKSGRRVATVSASDKGDLPTPPNSSNAAIDPPRPPPPARSRSAFGMTSNSPITASHIITPPIMEDTRSLEDLNNYQTLPSRPLPTPVPVIEASASAGTKQVSASIGNLMSDSMIQSVHSTTSSSSGGTLMSDSTHSAVMQSSLSRTDAPSAPPVPSRAEPHPISSSNRSVSVTLPAPPLPRHTLNSSPSALFAFDLAISEKVHAKVKVLPRTDSSAAPLSTSILKLGGVLSLVIPASVARNLVDAAAVGKSPASFRFRLNGSAAVEHIQVSKTLVTALDAAQTAYSVNVNALIDQLRDQLTQKATATSFSVDCVKYQCASPPSSTNNNSSITTSCLRAPLDFTAFWKCDSAETDYRLEYTFRPESLTTGSQSTPPTLTNLMFQTKVNGGMQSMRPLTGTLDHAKHTVTWRVPDVNDSSRRVVVANWQLANGPSAIEPTMATFMCENYSIAAISFEVVATAGNSFKLGSVRRTLTSGMYECDGAPDANLITPPHSAAQQTQQPFDAFSF